MKLSYKQSQQRHEMSTYLGWSGYQTYSSQPTIQIDPKTSQTLSLPTKSEVSLYVQPHPPSITSAEVEPLTSEDWDLIQIHAGLMENTIIQQSRCLTRGQQFVYFVSGSGVSVVMKVIKLKGISGQDGAEESDIDHGILGPLSEIAVAPKSRQPTAGKPSVKRSSSQTRTRDEKPSTILKRAVSFENEEDLKGFEIGLNRRGLPLGLRSQDFVYCSVVPSPSTNLNNNQPSSTPGSEKSEEELSMTKKIVVKITHKPQTPINQVTLSPLLASSLSILGQIGTMIKLQSIPKFSTKSQASSLKVHKIVTQTEGSVSGNGKKTKEDISARKKRLDETRKLLTSYFNEDDFIRSAPLTSGMKLPYLDLTDGSIGKKLIPQGFIVKFNSEPGYIIPDAVKKKKWNIDIAEDILVAESQVPQPIINASIEKKGEEALFLGQDKLLNQLLTKIHSTASASVGLLITGASGSGKSSLIKTIVSSLSSNTTITTHQPFHAISIDCASLAMQPFAQCFQQIQSYLTSALWHSPSVIVMESMESLFPSESEQGDSTQQRQLVECFISQWSHFKSNIPSSGKVVLIGSVKSKDSIHPMLTSSHLFSETYQLKPPSKHVREDIIVKLLSRNEIVIDPSFDLSQLSSETEGYSMKDLHVLSERILHEAIYETTITNKSERHLTSGIFHDAIKDFIPSSLRGINLAKPSSALNWSSIGGLTSAKTLLLETLEWPTKYAPIFKAATLRLRSGVLLYGHPGCGKTLLASAVAAQCGLNFISVKGPEILNKYIGASEQSVRDLFDRASAAKPCVLFFDEFDSIAPKRGADSTGVTDRVVNQMLTQMDGAEGLDGVYVLAATSRPDLIDSALLRPGRLDKAVLCGMPSVEETEDILKCVTSTMSLATGVDLTEIANGCQGFSGADLQAVGYNAYLKAVNRKLAKESNEESEEDGISSMDKKSSNGAGTDLVHEFFQLSFNAEKLTSLKPSERNKINHQIKSLLDTPTTISEEESTTKSSSKSKPELLITQQDLLDSLAETKPSISASEMNKLNSIYAKFDDTNEREADMQTGEGDHDTVGGRVTLA